ncbi:MAG TPA: hypothetical protein VG602_07480 [Actinomycetota bacterium]|nr:hypothetical protein [Actinomycetota bacterium]
MDKPIRSSRFGRRATLGIVAALAVLASFPASAAPAPDKGKKNKPVSDFFPFEYGIDVSAWYWERQVDQEVTTPPGVPVPVPVSQRVRGPNPYTASTLPVGVYQGAHERMAAVRFDLTERGVTPGSEIRKAILFIEESPQTEREPPPVRPETAKIEACLLTDLLSPGENEQFKDRPGYSEDEADCVEGKRAVAAGAAPLWTFDLTKIAEVWGKDPFANNGVMLLGVLQNTGETWQVNLKLPTKESTATAENDYELTKNRARLQLEFIPGDEPLVPPVKPPAAPSGDTATGSSSAGSSPSVGTVTPSTDLTGASGGGSFPSATGTDVAAAPPALPTTPQAISQPQPTGPRLPGYVWLLIPAGLLALAAVRSVVLEPVGGTRADGVIAAIRRRNAERRGGALQRRTGLLSRSVGTVRRGAAGTRTMFAKLARTVGRKR